LDTFFPILVYCVKKNLATLLERDDSPKEKSFDFFLSRQNQDKFLHGFLEATPTHPLQPQTQSTRTPTKKVGGHNNKEVFNQGDQIGQIFAN
jgi:hypothetical protein